MSMACTLLAAALSLHVLEVSSRAVVGSLARDMACAGLRDALPDTSSWLGDRVSVCRPGGYEVFGGIPRSGFGDPCAVSGDDDEVFGACHVCSQRHDDQQVSHAWKIPLGVLAVK